MKCLCCSNNIPEDNIAFGEFTMEGFTCHSCSVIRDSTALRRLRYGDVMHFCFDGVRGTNMAGHEFFNFMNLTMGGIFKYGGRMYVGNVSAPAIITVTPLTA